MTTPPGARLSPHHPPLRTDSVRKRLAEAVKSKTMHHQQQHSGKVYDSKTKSSSKHLINYQRLYFEIVSKDENLVTRCYLTM